MPRYSKCSCAHEPLPVDGTGGRRSDKRGPHAGLQAVPQICSLRRSPDSLFILHALRPPLPQTGLRKKRGRRAKQEGRIEGRAHGGGKEAQCERIVLTVGEPEQNGECPSLWTVGGRAWQPTSVSLVFVCASYFPLSSQLLPLLPALLVETPLNHCRLITISSLQYPWWK